jgi:hypothetical protein
MDLFADDLHWFHTRTRAGVRNGLQGQVVGRAGCDEPGSMTSDPLNSDLAQKSWDIAAIFHRGSGLRNARSRCPYRLPLRNAVPGNDKRIADLLHRLILPEKDEPRDISHLSH